MPLQDTRVIVDAGNVVHESKGGKNEATQEVRDSTEWMASRLPAHSSGKIVENEIAADFNKYEKMTSEPNLGAGVAS